MNGFNRLYFLKKTTNDFFIQIKKNKNKYIIFDSSGKPERQNVKLKDKNNYVKDIVRVVFFGYKVFNEEVCENSKINFFPVENGFVKIPYILSKNSKKDFLSIQISTKSNVFPIIIHYISDTFELLNNCKQEKNFDFVILYKYSETSMKDIVFIYLHLKEAEILILKDKILNFKPIGISKSDSIKFDGNHIYILKQLIKQGKLDFLKRYLSDKVLSVDKVRNLQTYVLKLKKQESMFSINYIKFLNECIKIFNLYKCFLFDSPSTVKSKNFDLDLIAKNLFSVLKNVLTYRINNSKEKKEKMFFWSLKTNLEKRQFDIK